MAKKTQELDESWQRFPEARIRMREGGLKTILEGLGEDGFCLGSIPRIIMDDEGVYVEILLNVGKHGSIVALPLEILIPAKMPPKKSSKEKKVNEVIKPESPPDAKLHNEPKVEAGPAPSNDGV